MTRAESYRLAQAGDLTALYEAHRTMVRGLAYKLCRDPNQVDDVSQDIWLQVYQHLHQFQGESNFGVWLFRVGFNTFFSGRRRHRPTLTSLETFLSEATQLKAVEVLRVRDERLLMVPLMVDLKKALSQLSKGERKVLTGLLTGHSKKRSAAYASRIYRARKHLRQRLGL